MKKAQMHTQRKNYEFLMTAKTVEREILAERDVPDVIENVVTLR